MPKVFIIILNWNGKDDTIECIESLRKIDYQDYKIVVIDNGSSDGSMYEIPKKYFNDISFIETKKNFGFAGGNNIGIKYAIENGADFILLINNDTIVEPDFLKKIVETAQNDAKIGIAGPLICFYDKREKIWFGGGQLNWTKTKGTHIDYGKILSGDKLKENKIVDYITGCCLLIKKEVIEKVGVLSEDYFLYDEDADFCLKAKKAGFKSIFVPAARIYHKQSRSAGEFSYPYIYYHTRNGLIMGSREGCIICAYVLSFWIFIKQVIKLMIGYKKNWAKPTMKGVTDFWRRKKGKLEGYY